MPLIQYSTKRLAEHRLATIQTANEIIAEYARINLDLTLRQLYYQFVSRDLIPNNDKEYNKLGDAIADGRLAGLIDWDAITDRMRVVTRPNVWDSPQQRLHAVARYFQLDVWQRQPHLVMVLIEKDALIGVIEGVCNQLRVPYMACRGYSSVSALWSIGHEHLRPWLQDDEDHEATILYLGDHDPSGIDMTRDVKERINLFVGSDEIGREVNVERLALNMDQVELYEPPPNPTKLSDSRAGDYIERFGQECWELDALNPTVIVEMVRAAILARRDDDLWDAAINEENDVKRQLAAVADNWEDVIARLEEE